MTLMWLTSSGAWLAIALTSPDLDVLEPVMDPCSIRIGQPLNILELGLVDELEVDESTVRCTITLTSAICPFGVQLLGNIESALEARWPGRKIALKLTGDVWLPDRRKRSTGGSAPLLSRGIET
jgi:metal-sulfur cluster biosynthetic enzyme